jgi:vacuolar protein sorting-associated protein 13A/C
MAKSILLKVLHEHFGKYVVGINEENLKLGIWAGQVDLRNLEIKKEALDDLKLPMDIKVGHIDRLHADIPWSKLGHEPVKVTIDGVYLLAVIRDNADDDHADTAGKLEDSDHAKKQAMQKKFEQLKWADLIERSTADNENSVKNQDTSFMSRLASKVMDNLQIVITNVHIRFEDSVGPSNANAQTQDFAFGVTLERFEAVTCDANGVKQFVTPETDRTIMYKTIVTKSVAVYWDAHLATSAVDSSVSMPSLRDALRRTIRTEVDSSEYKGTELLKNPAGASRVLLERRKDPNFVLRPCSISLFVAKNTTAGMWRPTCMDAAFVPACVDCCDSQIYTRTQEMLALFSDCLARDVT